MYMNMHIYQYVYSNKNYKRRNHKHEKLKGYSKSKKSKNNVNNVNFIQYLCKKFPKKANDLCYLKNFLNRTPIVRTLRSKINK